MKDVEKWMSDDILMSHRKYAEEIIKMYYGEEFINQVEERYNTVANGGISENIETFEIKESMLENGISVNATKEKDVNRLITTINFNNGELIIQKGKKQFKKIILVK